MKKMLLVTTMLGVLLAAVSPALAALQVDGEGPLPPEFVLNEDGTLVQGGDIIYDCPNAFRELEQYRDVDTEDESVPFELRQQLSQSAAAARLCEQNGFSPSGTGTPSAAGTESSGAPVADRAYGAAPSGAPEATVGSEAVAAELPATGGPAPRLALGALLLAVVGFALAKGRRASS